LGWSVPTLGIVAGRTASFYRPWIALVQAKRCSPDARFLGFERASRPNPVSLKAPSAYGTGPGTGPPRRLGG